MRGCPVRRVSNLLAAVAQEADMPEAARTMLTFLGRQVEHLDGEIARLDAAQPSHPDQRRKSGD